MNTTIDRDRDEALCDSLMGIMSRLRGYAPRGFEGGDGELLSREADRFVGRVARHLRYAHRILFPAFRELESNSTPDLERLEEEHRLLRLAARDLGLQIRNLDKEQAYDVSRSLLAVLLDHLRRETEDIDRFVHSLDVSNSGRLARALVASHSSDDRARS